MGSCRPKSGATREELHDVLRFLGYVVDYPRSKNSDKILNYNVVYIGNELLPTALAVETPTVLPEDRQVPAGMKMFEQRLALEGLKHLGASQAAKVLEDLPPEMKMIMELFSGVVQDIKHINLAANWTYMINHTAENLVDEFIAMLLGMNAAAVVNSKEIAFEDSGVVVRTGQAISMDKLREMLKERFVALYSRKALDKNA